MNQIQILSNNLSFSDAH